METPAPASTSAPRHLPDAVRPVASSGVAWGSVLGGAVVAAALALILVLLGTGLGLAAVSPWSYDGASAKNVAIAAIVWMIFTHLSASAMGGYLAGRLRTKWGDVHTDEVFFRDTANGLVAWAVGVVLTAAFLTAAATSIVSGTAKAVGTATAAAGAGMAAGAASAKGPAMESNAYFIDELFRSDRAREDDDAAVREEAGRIVANGLRQGDLPAADKTYLGQVVAARTGLGQPESEKRVADVIAKAQAAEVKAREAADAARKAATHMSLWTFIALLMGAFTASYAATIGGRNRDRV